MEQATKKMQKLFKSMIAQGLDPSSLLKSIPQSSAAPSGTDVSHSSGTMKSEEEDDSDGLSGDEYENKSSHRPITSSPDSQDEEEDISITPGHAKTTDSGDVNATDVSSNDNDTPARKKKQQELYCEFTWAELSHSIEPILPIPKPDGTGGRDYSIKGMIGLGSNHQDDADTYKDILVIFYLTTIFTFGLTHLVSQCSVRSHCGKNLDLSLPMRKQVKAKIVLVELKVCEDFPLLRNFAGGWPVHALIQQYLKNTTEQARKSALRQAARVATMPAASSNNLTHVPLPAAPLISTAKSKSKKKSAAASVQPAAKPVKSSKANRALDNRHVAPSVVSDAPIAKVKSSKANRVRENRQAAPLVVSDIPIAKNTFSSKSKVRPRPNFAAVETCEPDVTHDLETLDIGTASQTAKSKKKKSVAVAASMASKKGVSGVKRKKPVKDDDGPGPSKRYKTLESIPVPAKGKEKTAKITKAAKGAPSKISSSTAAGSSGVRKTKCQPVPSARARGDHP
ncbi:hypothetical protein JB92DRAFT_3127664 [Gautieria morchelliformis]|nr:hypothetical protein JB92DRAFT_3127664 [Gautieria morchelliformis]